MFLLKPPYTPVKSQQQLKVITLQSEELENYEKPKGLLKIQQTFSQTNLTA
jgi:hypothetical protein